MGAGLLGTKVPLCGEGSSPQKDSSHPFPRLERQVIREDTCLCVALSPPRLSLDIALAVSPEQRQEHAPSTEPGVNTGQRVRNEP